VAEATALHAPTRPFAGVAPSANTFDVAAITAKEAGLRSLGDAWADTTTPHGRLMLTVLGGFGRVRARPDPHPHSEGRNRAKLRGKHMGRPPSLTPTQQKEATRRRAQGATLQELADSYDRSIATMRRMTRAEQHGASGSEVCV
jgi:DNA invertase Pin-like site-specific DNA recombinase